MDLKKRTSLSTEWHVSHAFISTVVTTMTTVAKDGEIILENKHLNGLEINLECAIITFNHRFSVCNVCCDPPSILMPSASRLALLSTSGRNKR